MKCFRDLKRSLFESDSPAVPGIGVIKEVTFLEKLFPDDFLSACVNMPDKTVLFSNVFQDRAQRNKLINGRYNGYVICDGIAFLLQNQPQIWDGIRERCNRIASAAEPSTLRQILMDHAQDIQNGELLSLVRETIDTDPAFALAIISLFLVVGGNVQYILPLFAGENSLLNRFSYMDNAVEQFIRPHHLPDDWEQSLESLAMAYNEYSVLLSYVTKVQKGDDPNSKEVYSHLFDHLYDVILQNYPEKKKLIHISGPAGSGKNAITQFLYLNLANNVKRGIVNTIAPFYLNLNRYRKKNLSYDDAIRLLEQDTRPFFTFCNQQPHRTPILFVDGIRNYNAGEVEVDYQLNKLIRRNIPEVRLVCAAENAAILNNDRQRKAPDFANGRFMHRVVIDSLYLGDAKAASYLAQFERIQSISIRFSIADKLQALHIEKVDTSQLQMLFPHLEDANTISDLYETACLNYLNGNTAEFKAAAQWAYDFAYTNNDLPDISVSMRRLLSTHDSFQEYFIARWYLEKIRSNASEDNIGTLNMVLPKGVTRFIVPLLNESTADENLVLNLIQENYRNMGLLAKSEMTYWLGRIKSAGMAQQAENLLEEYYLEQRELAVNARNPNILTDKEMQFLLRGISVSLIVKGHMDVSEEYLELLIENDLANEINRGFHLEYYGDKKYLPSYNTLDFMDSVSVGRRTLEQLLSANAEGIVRNRILPIFDLNLFTVFSLLQARIEYHTSRTKFDIIPYMRRAMEQADWYLRSGRCHSQKIQDYFKMAMHDFDVFLATPIHERRSVGAKTYDTYCTRVLRTGWVKRKIPSPETVAEHMYHTWLLGMLFLPNESSESGYSKAAILDLVLIHDLAESVTGDIERPVKDRNRAHYDKQESNEMAMFLLRGTYPSLPNQNMRYELWQEWFNPKTINGKIAKELDLIQTMFQLLTYYLQYPDLFDLADLKRWMGDRHDVQTLIGRSILQQVVLENRDFNEVLQLIATP